MGLSFVWLGLLESGGTVSLVSLGSLESCAPCVVLVLWFLKVLRSVVVSALPWPFRLLCHKLVPHVHHPCRILVSSEGVFGRRF